MDGIKVDFEPIVHTKKTPDDDISKSFIKHVVKLTHQIDQEYYSKPKPYNLTPQEEKDSNQQDIVIFVKRNFSEIK